MQEPLPLQGSLKPIKMPSYGNQSAAFLQTIPVALGTPSIGIPANTRVTLLLGSVLIREGDLILLIGYFPSTSEFTVNQLEPFVNPALAKL